MVTWLEVIHTQGHTPGHISLYCSEDRFLLGADVFYKNVFGADHMYISPAILLIDPITAWSAQRLSKVKFDKLLMSHQDSILVERSNETVEQLVSKKLSK